MIDDRITCPDCANLRNSECSAFGYRSGRVLDLLRRCELFAPKKDAQDQRPGSQRWPTLYADYEKVRSELATLKREAAQRGISRARKAIELV